jgi:ribonuclease R
VCSKAKLSYQEVDGIIDGNTEHDMSAEIATLQACFRALRSWREQNELVIEHRTDYRWILDETKQIGSIEPVAKRTSQILVEECMVAANKAIANELRASDKPGPFVTHAGIRRDKSDEAKEFLNRFLPEMAETDFSTIEGFRALINALNAATDERPLRAMVNRLMARASFSVKAAPHMGMAVPLYTNGTSPLRKALDYCVHLQLKAMLGDTTVTPAQATVFDAINQASAKNRQAVNTAQNWLTCNFLNKLAAGGENQFDASVVHINTSGFTVRLDKNGLEGVVDLRSHNDKFSFDKWEMSLKSKNARFALGQQIRVEYQPVEKPRGTQAAFSVLASSSVTATDSSAPDDTPKT